MTNNELTATLTVHTNGRVTYDCTYTNGTQGPIGAYDTGDVHTNYSRAMRDVCEYDVIAIDRKEAV